MTFNQRIHPFIFYPLINIQIELLAYFYLLYRTLYLQKKLTNNEYKNVPSNCLNTFDAFNR